MIFINSALVNRRKSCHCRFTQLDTGINQNNKRTISHSDAQAKKPLARTSPVLLLEHDRGHFYLSTIEGKVAIHFLTAVLNSSINSSGTAYCAKLLGAMLSV